MARNECLIGETHYSVGVEICRIETQEDADRIAELIRDRLSDINEYVYLFTSRYEKTREHETESEGVLEEDQCLLTY